LDRAPWDDLDPPEPTEAELDADYLDRIELAADDAPPIVFSECGVPALICPACEAGDHEHAYLCEADYKCACACHEHAPPRKLPIAAMFRQSARDTEGHCPVCGARAINGQCVLDCGRAS